MLLFGFDWIGFLLIVGVAKSYVLWPMLLEFGTPLQLNEYIVRLRLLTFSCVRVDLDLSKLLLSTFTATSLASRLLKSLLIMRNSMFQLLGFQLLTR